MSTVKSYEQWAKEWNEEYPDDLATEEGYEGYLYVLDGP